QIERASTIALRAMGSEPRTRRRRVQKEGHRKRRKKTAEQDRAPRDGIRTPNSRKREFKKKDTACGVLLSRSFSVRYTVPNKNSRHKCLLFLFGAA
ncbi:MAG: hypothetical protein J6R04_02980, partial [Clostridia bacterium]|nr:hypothetical protein [Clostridia bacterium]